VSPFGPEIFAKDTSEVQGLFLKALSPIADSTWKFFGRTSFDPEAVNVVALRWEPPQILYDAEVIPYTQEKLESLFAAFDLRLKIFIFVEPPALLPLLKKYR
jgi:hypothetical protein